MNFTSKERQVLYHRLGVPETIADALGLNFEDTEYSCDYLTRCIAGGRSLVTNALSQEERIILLNCVQGSTWAIIAQGLPSYYAACQTLTKLARKFEAEDLGHNIAVPT